MSALRSVTPERSIKDIANDIQERGLEQHSLAMLLRAVFFSLADEDSELHHRRKELWEGLAVVARHVGQDGVEINSMVDELRNKLEKSGAR